MLGLFLGDYGFKRLNQNSYRGLVLAVLITVAVVGVINGVSRSELTG